MAFENYRSIADIVMQQGQNWPNAAKAAADGIARGRDAASRRDIVNQRQQVIDRDEYLQDFIGTAAVLDSSQTPEEAEALWNEQVIPLYKRAGREPVPYSIQGHRSMVEKGKSFAQSLSGARGASTGVHSTIDR